MAHPRFVPDGRTDLYGFASDVRTAADLLRAGLRVLQFRAKEMDDRRFREAAGAVLAEVRKFPGAVLIVNDRVDIALEIGADGVHVGPEDEPAEAVRARIPADFILGVSARTPERARAAERAGADYLGVGAVFSTTTKADAKTIGLEGLKAAMRATALPVTAIGGIAPENVRRVRDAGCRYAAVLSAINDAPDIAERVREFRRILKRGRGDG